MATQTANPTSEVSVTGTWSGTDRHLLLDDHPDSGNPVNDSTTCSAAGVLIMGFPAFTVPAGSTSISVQVLYEDFKNGSQASTIGAAIRCNDTTNRLSGTHNPGNGNANIALRNDNYATNPKSGAAWTVDDVNGVGTNGLTSFGVSVTDASPTVTVSSAQLQVTYTPPAFTGTADATLQAITASAFGTVSSEVTGTGAATLQALTASASGTYTDPPITGTGAATLQALTVSASGTNTVPEITGAAAATLQALIVAGVGEEIFSGAANSNLAALTVSATGQQGEIGSLAAQLAALAVAASGTVASGATEITGAANISLSSLAVAGAGLGLLGNASVVENRVPVDPGFWVPQP